MWYAKYTMTLISSFYFVNSKLGFRSNIGLACDNMNIQGTYFDSSNMSYVPCGLAGGDNTWFPTHYSLLFQHLCCQPLCPDLRNAWGRGSINISRNYA